MADNEYIKRSEVVGLIEDKIKRCVTVPVAFVCASLRTEVMGLRSADVASRAEWISVEERLPESDDRCIVWSFDYIWHIRFGSYYRETKRWYVVCGDQIKDTKRDGVKVTHWMPLPKPPKGDHHE